MTGDQLYDLVKEQMQDDAFKGMNPAWHYFRTKLLIRCHLMEQVYQPAMWRFK